MRRLIAILLVALPVLAGDITGSWNFKVTSARGEHTATLTVTQEGEKFSGTFDSERGPFKAEGTVKDAVVEFTVLYTGGDAPSAIPFRGKLESPTRMAGQYTAGESGGGWTAEKAK